MTRKLILMLTVILSLIIASVACTPAQKPMPPEPDRRPAPITPAPQNDGSGMHQRAMKIAEEVDKLEGVKKAYVVISDSMGYIGLDLDRNLEDGKVDALKKDAETRAKSIDKSLTNVMVTSDVDTVTRIKKVAEGVRNGKPVTGFTKELEEIGRRIKPTTR
ncbi:MAG: YhcN/YlaJ family sporulation lipoprotein [Clostridia bacterium]|jgi:YhcN/YlaJ family sporulation lipoprotein|nr:YhcN/YlaJ family sporulation lipoprotein [Clostridia bacterium]